jgi:hypothetical protein
MSILKVIMINLHVQSACSKYAYEILRYLVHQKVVLSQKQAYECFFNQFVNYRGSIDSHIPVDLAMEYLVKDYKRLIKHMFSSKTAKNIIRRSSALAAVRKICENYDCETGTVIRATRHKTVSAYYDELQIIKDLRDIKPFNHTAGRFSGGFECISRSVFVEFSCSDMITWIEKRVKLYAYELGK